VALDAQTIQGWASARGNATPRFGGIGKPKTADDPGSDEGTGDLDDTGDLGDDGHDSIWAGEESGEIDEERAQQLLDWLKENEPELEDPIRELAEAITTGDEEMREHAHEELLQAKQRNLDDYEEFTESQREELDGELSSALGEANYPDPTDPEWAVAVAKAIGQVRSEGEDDLLDEDDEDERSEDEDEIETEG